MIGLLFAGALGVIAAQNALKKVRSGLDPPAYTVEPDYRVSLCITAYQEERYIGRLLASAHNQTYPFHDMVVGDSSNDHTGEIARYWGARVVPVPAGNISMGRNAAANGAHGDILIFADADVMFHCQFVERAVAALARGAALVHPREVIYDSAFWNAWLYLPQVTRPWWNTTRCVAVWRNVWEEVGGYDPACNPTTDRCREDLDFGSRVAEAYGRGSIRTLPFLIGTSARRYKAQGLRGWERFDEPARARRGS